jgi:Tol biopolymer transport system component
MDKILGGACWFCLATVLLLALGGCGSSSGGASGFASGLMSNASDGTQADGFSKAPTLSADGRHVLFDSVATDQVAEDTDLFADVILRDRMGGARLISVSTDDVKGLAASDQAFISADASLVVFASAATLDAADGNVFNDVYLRNLTTGTTGLVSTAFGGGNADDFSGAPSITPDGRYVLYRSRATNLLAGADANNAMDIFLYDMVNDVTERVSLADGGGEANSHSETAGISDDGRYVVFDTSASNLIIGDANNAWDVFLHDRSTGSTVRLSEDAVGNGGNGDSRAPSISADGSHVVFHSSANNLVAGDTNLKDDVFLYRLSDGALTRISVHSDGSQAIGHSRVTPTSAISADGGRIAFHSDAENLDPDVEVNGFNDVFVHNVASASTTLVSLTPTMTSGDHESDSAAISDDGNHVAFHSYASNLVATTTRQQWEVFAITLPQLP